MKALLFKYGITIGLLILFQTSLFAQTWENFFADSERQYQKGNYKSALSKSESAVKKNAKAGKATDVYNAWVGIVQAKYHEALGDYTPVEGKIERALSILANNKHDEFEPYAVAVCRAVDVYIQYGNYLTAHTLISGLAEEAKSKNLGANSLISMEIQHRLANVYIHIGKLNEAQQIIENILPAWQSSFEKTINGAAPSEEDTEYRQEQYAQLLIFKGNILTAKGEYEQAQTWLDERQDEVKQMAGKGDIYARHLMAMGDNHYDGEAYNKAESYYRSAQNKAEKGSKTYIKANEKLIRTYIKDGNLQLAEGKLNELKRTVSATTKGENIYQYIARLLEAEIYAGREKFKQADKLFNEVLSAPKNVVPYVHDLRAEASEKFYRIRAGREFKLNNAKKNLLYSMNITRQLYGDSSTLYQKYEVELANFDVEYTNDLKNAGEIYQKNPHKNILAQLSPVHKDYGKVLQRVAKYYDITDNYDKAIELFGQSAKVTQARYGENTPETARAWAALANVEVKAGSYQHAETHINTFLEVLGRKSPEAAIAARFYAEIGDFDQAERTFRTAARRDDDSKEDLAYLYVKVAEFDKAKDLLHEVITENVATFGKKSKVLVRPYIELGKAELLAGNYAEAETHAKKAMDLASDIFGENSIKFAESKALLAQIYSEIGDYEKANTNAEEVVSILGQVLHSDHVKVAQAVTAYALIKFRQDKKLHYEEVKLLLEDAQRIILKNFDENHPLYAENLTHLANLEISKAKDIKDLNRPFKYLAKADTIWTHKLGEGNLYSARIAALAGDLYGKAKMFKKAKENYTRAERIYKRIFSEQHPDYVRTLSRLGRMFYVSGNYKKADSHVEQAMFTYLDYINKYFPSLSEREKAKYWKKVRSDFEFYNTLAVERAQENEKVVGNMYNFSLATKALLLNSANQIKEKVADNKQYGRVYRKWLDAKEYRTKLLGKTPEQLAMNQISIADVDREIEELEKKLGQFPGLFSDSRQFEWEEVRGTLEKNEAAVEIIQYRHFENGFTDQNRYAALIITKKSRIPKLVLFEKGNEMEKKYFIYYRNGVIFSIEDEYSYKTYWKPIMDELDPEITKVYLSPDGVYNQINVESMQMEDGNFVVDRMRVLTVSNTKDLVLEKERNDALSKRERRAEADRNRVAFIMANPTFYTSDDSKLLASRKAAKRGSKEHGNTYIKQLPGSEREAHALKKLLETDQIDIKQFYLGDEATETLMKSFRARSVSPRIVHIATHGYFANQQTDFEDDVNFEDDGDFTRNDPLLQSGLLLKGAGDLFAQTSEDALPVGDGVLTAYEVMNLNFNDTELVVLSACETGRGELQSGEGVFGLQRAFLVAGAEALVISLFKVPDKETAEFMETFYKKWIFEGKDKREAFHETQLTMKAKYRETIYWAAFNMIGL